MESAKVLFVSQEITPYLPESEISYISRYLPQGMQDRGMEIRTFMPKYGNINERRNQLHEVIRLSGMNLIIDDTDHPLIIKVASIQSARMQVYFIDNDDYFSRKATVADSKGIFFEDNDERMIFFARGVLETVRKLRWSPDLVHCHGWFTSLVPLYLKKAYKEDPLFADTKVIFSLYNNEFDSILNESFKDKILIDGISSENVKVVSEPSHHNLIKLVAIYSDGLIQGSSVLSDDTLKVVKGSGKPVMNYVNSEDYIEKISVFYESIINSND
ncbi:MAG TPA: glycogen synthase [Bacteroidaceae bacterium]|nr:glycogen synthase [Bacteroidaceae bacterium]